jgi:hypothetical protein
MLARETSSQSKPKPKKPREPHVCTPIIGEFGRYTVPSRSEEGDYIVDVLAEEQTETHGLVVGTCPCKGWSVRKTCTHLDDCKIEHAKREAARLGFEDLNKKD